jgi:hypothetical protein
MIDATATSKIVDENQEYSPTRRAGHDDAVAWRRLNLAKHRR